MHTYRNPGRETDRIMRVAVIVAAGLLAALHLGLLEG